MGYENVDTNAVKKYNILLGNTIFTKTRVAELTVGLLIATARNFLVANQRIKTYFICFIFNLICLKRPGEFMAF